MDPMNPQSGETPQEPFSDPAAGQKIIGYCRACGKPLTDSTKRPALGTIYCDEHAPSVNAPPPVEPPSPYAAPRSAAPMSGISPGLAFALGFVPGVGAIYNGQYAKGFVHVVVFGLLVSILSSDTAGGMEPLFGIMLAAFVFYQAFEAYHTAKRRELGQPVDEFSSLMAMSPHGVPSSQGFFAGPIILIVIGVVFLLSNLGVLHIRQILRFWPLILIAIGVSMLMNRVRGNGARPHNGHIPEGMPHEQR